MMNIIQGNLDELTSENPRKRGWFIGDFIEEESVFHNKGFEVKWGSYKKGIIKQKPAASNASTLAILITGKCRISFGEKEYLLEKQGDYLWFGPGTKHTSEALEQTRIITIRWK